MTHMTLVAGLLSILAVVSAATPQRTIPEMVAANPDQPLTMLYTEQSPQMPFNQLIDSAELIVIAQLGPPKSYLTASGQSILTDYQVIPRRMIFDRSLTTISTRPEQLPPLTLTVPGGEMFLSGVKVTLTDSGRVPWKQGADVLLFLLNREDKRNGFWLHGGSAGAFEVGSDGRVKSLKVEGPKEPEIDGVELEQVVQKIASRVKEKDK
jgi:hypothetical protein